MIIHGDAEQELRALARRRGWNRARVVVLADPPWPDCEHVDIHGATTAVETWRCVVRDSDARWVAEATARLEREEAQGRLRLDEAVQQVAMEGVA